MLFTQVVRVGGVQDQGIVSETLLIHFLLLHPAYVGEEDTRGETIPSFPTAALLEDWETAT